MLSKRMYLRTPNVRSCYLIPRVYFSHNMPRRNSPDLVSCLSLRHGSSPGGNGRWHGLLSTTSFGRGEGGVGTSTAAKETSMQTSSWQFESVHHLSLICSNGFTCVSGEQEASGGGGFRSSFVVFPPTNRQTINRKIAASQSSLRHPCVETLGSVCFWPVFAELQSKGHLQAW